MNMKRYWKFHETKNKNLIYGGLIMKKALLKATALALVMVFAMSCTAFAASGADIDTSNANNGYVRAKCNSNKRVKVQVQKDGKKYNYDLNANGNYENFSLQMGNGTYTIKIFENTTGNRYASVDSAVINVNMSNSLAPYLVSNQQVNYNSNSKAVATAAGLTQNAAPLKKVENIFNYVTKNISYDTYKAKTVKSGYLPNIDSTLATKKGICYDYASLMAAMLRSQGVPTKLVKGYVAPSNVYHAWTEVYLQGEGWVNVNQVYFDGKTFRRMDPTFASTGHQSQKINQFIGNGSNYSKAYEY